MQHIQMVHHRASDDKWIVQTPEGGTQGVAQIRFDDDGNLIGFRRSYRGPWTTVAVIDHCQWQEREFDFDAWEIRIERKQHDLVYVICRAQASWVNMLYLLPPRLFREKKED